jgi:hypothetical protein
MIAIVFNSCSLDIRNGRVAYDYTKNAVHPSHLSAVVQLVKILQYGLMEILICNHRRFRAILGILLGGDGMQKYEHHKPSAL